MKKFFAGLILFLFMGVAVLSLMIWQSGQWAKGKLTQEFSKVESQTELKSFLSKVSGVQKLQVAELDQMEKITRESHRKVFWEKLELPVVVVSVEIPVNYTYFVDLSKAWSAVESSEGNWTIVVPDLEYNPPAAEISSMKVKVEKASLFRNEEAIKNQLMSELSLYLQMRAEEHKTLVKEQSRREIQQMVEKWLMDGNEDNNGIEVFFYSEIEEQKKF